ncbi:MAG TPA: phage baseplate assembly protein V [Gemmatimonadaceae bacterium]|nr:phage baseplate assembly protein V [Gemmatimonadaceae bacterium]
MTTIFDLPHAPTGMYGTQLARVVSVSDPDHLGRVQVRVLNFDAVADQDAPLWARVAVPFAGNNRGAFLIPDVDDEVIVTFVNGDPRLPIVVGGLWNGAQSPPEQLGGDRVDRWTIVGKAGTRIAIVEESSGEATISLTTPDSQQSLTIKETAGGEIKLDAAGGTITMDTTGITINTGAKVTVQASTVDVSAGMVTVDAAMSSFSGIVRCDTLITNTVVSTTYTPGAGNVW